METKQVTSWAEIVDVLQDIERRYSKTVIDEYVERHLILFRGLSDSNWPLETTLERQSARSWNVRSYYDQIYYCAPQIESFLGTSWNLRKLEDLEKDLTANISDVEVKLPHYDYWAYLRHHGFPSPLLDWSESPYIALFFALCDQSSAAQAALYAYIETPMNIKVGAVGAPMITVQHRYVKTHKRHFLQQSYYTVATEITESSPKDHTFIGHERIFETDNKRQDILIKILFPRSIRLEVLSKLYTYNINHYSLFQTEDALIKSLALRELEISRSVG